MITLQASLLSNSYPLHYTHFPPLKLRQFSPSPLRSVPSSSVSVKSRFFRHRFILNSTLHSDNVNSDSADLLPEFDDSPVEELRNEADVAVEESSNDSKNGEESVEIEDSIKRLPVVVFLIGLYARLKSGFEKLALSKWFDWWPFWRHEKKLERLIAEADANPMDAVLQSVLLAELNKHK